MADVATPKNPFEYQKADAAQSELIGKFMEAYKDLYNHLLELKPSRETSLAITKLEEAAMWTNKSIAFNHQGE